ncbi:hypothetical protein ACJX0J_020410 [Zea mays]
MRIQKSPAWQKKKRHKLAGLPYSKVEIIWLCIWLYVLVMGPKLSETATSNDLLHYYSI